MDKITALEWAEMIRAYVYAKDDRDALEKADDIVSELTDCIARTAERDGWYPELQEFMNWCDKEA